MMMQHPSNSLLNVKQSSDCNGLNLEEFTEQPIKKPPDKEHHRALDSTQLIHTMKKTFTHSPGGSSSSRWH